MTPEEKIKGCLGRHPEWDDRRVAVACSVHLGDVKAVRAGQPIPENSAPAPAQEAAGLISLEKIIQKYDTKAAIEREIAALPKGKLIEESELCRQAAGTDRYRFRKTIENNPDAFRVFRIKLKLEDGEAKWFWGLAPDIAEARRIRNLYGQERD